MEFVLNPFASYESYLYELVHVVDDGLAGLSEFPDEIHVGGPRMLPYEIAGILLSWSYWIGDRFALHSHGIESFPVSVVYRKYLFGFGKLHNMIGKSA